MKENKIMKKEYELNVKLHALYEVIDALYNPLENKYPQDVKESINNLIDTLNKYLYHPIDGYDIIDEKYNTIITYQKH